MTRRILAIIAVFAAVFVVAGAAFTAWRLHDRDADIPMADVRPTPALIARGEYLVKAAD